MTANVALLRAVNVGGTGKLPMSELKAMGEACDFSKVRTFIASGNLLFESNLAEAEIKAALEAKLLSFAGKPVEVFVRTAGEIAAVIAANPFLDAHPSRHLVYFQDAAPAPDLITQCRDINGERLALGTRELYVDYGDGIRFTRLKIPGKADRTGRSINTVARLHKLLQSG